MGSSMSSENTSNEEQKQQSRVLKSENDRFMINLDQSEYLYSKDVLQLNFLEQVPKTSTTPLGKVNDKMEEEDENEDRKEDYHIYRYRPSSNYINDCLQFAEGLALERMDWSGKASIFREKKSNRLFGVSDENNILIAISSDKGREALPQIGEAYAVVSLRIVEGKSPYHIAFVIEMDGNTRITLEANACEDRLIPLFSMYSMEEGNTFYDAWEEYFTVESKSGQEEKDIILRPSVIVLARDEKKMKTYGLQDKCLLKTEKKTRR